jgi:hypothetical protein
MIEIDGLNARQAMIADMLWEAPTMKDVAAIVQAIGPDAAVVRDMLVAATYDEFAETDLAEDILRKFRL